MTISGDELRELVGVGRDRRPGCSRWPREALAARRVSGEVKTRRGRSPRASGSASSGTAMQRARKARSDCLAAVERLAARRWRRPVAAGGAVARRRRAAAADRGASTSSGLIRRRPEASLTRSSLERSRAGAADRPARPRSARGLRPWRRAERAALERALDLEARERDGAVEQRAHRSAPPSSRTTSAGSRPAGSRTTRSSTRRLGAPEPRRAAWRPPPGPPRRRPGRAAPSARAAAELEPARSVSAVPIEQTASANPAWRSAITSV